MKTLFAAIFTLAVTAGLAQAEDIKNFDITIKDHKFSPASLEIPANEKVKLTIINNDPTPEEFESHELNREKIIKGNSKGIVFVGPLEPGIYPYFGEFNMDTAKGEIVAK